MTWSWLNSSDEMESIIVGAPRCSQQGDATIVSAPVTLGPRRQTIWYRVEAGSVAAGAEPFLAATLLAAMAIGGRLKISGMVSDRLWRAIPTVQDIFDVWDPRFQRVSLETEKRRDPAVTGAGVACFFTGGVDSWFTLLKHFDEITHLIYVHGFDIHLDDSPLRATVSTTIRGVAAALHKPLIEVETNLRTFADQYVEWDYYHGAGLASVALLLSPRFRKVYIAATHSYASLYPLGSHPLLDPLWSTEGTEIVHDGCEATRVGKVACIAAHEIALRMLRVCWENRGGAYNCGRCNKCLRTMAALRVVGALDRCRSFDRPLDLTAVARIALGTRGGRDYIEQILRALHEGSIQDPPLERALRDCLSRKYHRGIWRLARQVLSCLRRVRRVLAPPRAPRRRGPTRS